MATAHNRAELGSIASIVIMPGDPLRAKYIAENYLTDFKLVTDVRNVLGYTGYYKNKLITVMASGMGIPSIGIYAYELYKFYNVDTIIRIGSVGSLKSDVNVLDLILTKESVTDSTFAKSFSNTNKTVEEGNDIINNKILNTAERLNYNIHFGNIYCDEAFYQVGEFTKPKIKEYDCLGVEMESFALFHVAKCLEKKASCILTVSNSLVTGEELSSEDREKSFNKMITLALESII